MKQHDKQDSKPNFPKMEKEVLKFWEKESIFEKTLKKTKDGKSFVFFEGPPTANGKPGIHHVLARAYKDIILRYKTMQGFFVERKAGWDTHGLPVELQVEKELKISGKPEIDKYGVEKFNKKCRESVWKYKKEWEEMTKRIGFWLDLDHPYITYENDYIESLWWIIKQAWDKGLLYKGHKVVPHCPRCGTALSSHEVALGYKEVTENSVYIKFKVIGQENTFILSWTTTPWTLPGNVALAVGEEIEYVKVKQDKEEYIFAKAVVERLEGKYKVIEEMKGKDLIGLEYEPLFDIKSLRSDNAYKVYTADFVNTEEGTGVVHTAVMYGEDDYQLGEKVGLPKHHTVDENGNFTKDVEKWAGKFVKDKDVEKGIVADLQERGLLYKEEMYKHDYPFCWRCYTPLLYYAKDSWFIRMSQLKNQLIKNNEDINWVPGYIKHGRFGEWLNELKDWAFSRERYWGTPLPIWECDKCGERKCIGSVEELKAKSLQSTDYGRRLDLHRPFVDNIKLKCKCGGIMKRVKEVIDAWFDSGSMPFAQWNYPFENKKRIDNGISFPAQYISEGIDQTRGWFYTLLAVSTLLDKGAPYKNIICLNLILDSKGQKMSKSKGNIVDPFEMMDKYGADTLRWHFFTMNQPGDTKLFDEKQLADVVRKNWMILWNVLSFWKMYSQSTDHKQRITVPLSKHVLDCWVIAELQLIIKNVTKHLDNYQVTEAGRLIGNFINELSTWYLRRSRSRFKQKGEDKQHALKTLQYIIIELAKLLAPFAPFVAESLFREASGPKSKQKSVHLADWPKFDAKLFDEKIIDSMQVVRQAVELGHSLRKEHQIKVRQPLAQFVILNTSLNSEFIELIKEEVNVQEVIQAKKVSISNEFVTKGNSVITVALDITITDELKEQGIIREMVRHINAMRKDARLTINDTITVYYEIADKELDGIFQHYQKEVVREVIATSCLKGLPDNIDLKKVLEIMGKKVLFGIKKK
jgi:isoleucyl-tRNA synthetase